MTRVLRVVSALLGLIWIAAAVAKIVAPDAGYELTATLVGGGAPALLALAATIAAETALGAAMLLGLWRGFSGSLGLIGAFTATAWWVSENTGPWVRCGCLGGDGTVDDALTRNAWVAGVLVVLATTDAVVRRRAARS